MSATYIPVALRRQVEDRAEHCCEYCLLPENVSFFPDSALFSLLFNPRTQKWNDHFALDVAARIISGTPEGRTTIRLLQFNTAERVQERERLIGVGLYPTFRDEV